MTYCRWTTKMPDGGGSDIYAQETDIGFVTHVLGGETFVDKDLVDFKARLLALRAAGYRFPDHALETVDAEIADATSPDTAAHTPVLERG